MNREQIIKMAKEAGFPSWWLSPPEPERDDYSVVMLERFASLVAAHEREQCAKVCEEFASCEGIAQACAAAIRARKA